MHRVCMCRIIKYLRNTHIYIKSDDISLVVYLGKSLLLYTYDNGFDIDDFNENGNDENIALLRIKNFCCDIMIFFKLVKNAIFCIFCHKNIKKKIHNFRLVYEKETRS